MKKYLLFVLLFTSANVYSSKPKADSILALGKSLYSLEKASWISTDYVMKNHPDILNNIGGYLSYENGNDYITSIFFSIHDANIIIAKLRFNKTNMNFPDSIILEKHQCSKKEKELITIRNKAIENMQADKSGYFTFYENTSFNFIPLISEDQKIVYILTAPEQTGHVLIGNDYKLTFDKNNKLLSKKKIHNSLIPIPFSKEGVEIEQTMHSHVNSEVIDITDICTLLLYKDEVSWNSHIVISKKYVSIFDLKKESLEIIEFEEYMNNLEK